MAFEWNFMQPQKIETKLKGMDAVQDSIQAPYTNPYERASYMDAYEADQNAQAQAAQQAMDQKNQRIASLEAQIANLEKSIAEKTAQLQNWSGVDDQIASIEASKINVTDPTMVWRWNRGREDAATQAQLNRAATERANSAQNYDAIAKFKNTADMIVGQRIPVLAASQEQMLRNVETAIRDGNNIGAHDDVKRLMERKAEIEDRLYGKKGLNTGMYQSGDRQSDITHYIDSLKLKNPSVEEIDSVLQYKDEMTPDQIKTLEGMRSDAEKRAKAAAKKAKDDATTSSWLSE